MFSNYYMGPSGHVYPNQIERSVPVAVIPFEDREQVERLLGRFYGLQKVAAVEINDFQAALREFANPTPPKPDEPTGLGAVVEDDKGDKWVSRGGSYMWPWCLAHPSGIGGSKSWSDIDAVKVLSEGVTA